MKRPGFYFSLMAAFLEGDSSLVFYFWIWGTGHPLIRGMSNVSRPWDMTCGHVSGHIPRFVSTRFHMLFLLPIRRTPIFTAAFNRRMTVLAEQLFRSFSAVVMAAVDTSHPKFAVTNSPTRHKTKWVLRAGASDLISGENWFPTRLPVPPPFLYLGRK